MNNKLTRNRIYASGRSVNALMKVVKAKKRLCDAIEELEKIREGNSKNEKVMSKFNEVRFYKVRCLMWIIGSELQDEYDDEFTEWNDLCKD